MKKRSWVSWGGICLALVLSLSIACSQTTAPTTSAPVTKATMTAATGTQATPVSGVKTIELALNLRVPPFHTRWLNVNKPWCDELEKISGGRVKVVPYFAEALSKPEDVYDSLLTGIADMAEGITSENPGRFPLSEAGSVPKLGIFCKDPSTINWTLYTEFPALQDEFKDIHMLWSHTGGASVGGIGFVDQPPLTLDGMKGKKMRTSGKWGPKQATALGMVPTSIPMGDVYLALQKKVVDGVYGIVDELLESRAWAEVCTNFIVCPVSYSFFYFAISHKSWEKIPADVQEWINKNSGLVMTKKTDEIMWQRNSQTRKWAQEEKKVKFYFLPSAEMAKMQQGTLPLQDQWVTESKKPAAKDVIARFNALLDKYSYIMTQSEVEGKS